MIGAVLFAVCWAVMVVVIAVVALLANVKLEAPSVHLPPGA